MCLFFPKVNTDEESLDSLLCLNSTNTPIVAKRRRLTESTSMSATSSSAAHVVAEGMKDAVKQLKEHRQHNEDEFDVFGKYIATELRSLSDPRSARIIRFKVARFLMDCIEAENQTTSDIYAYEENVIVQAQEPNG